MHTIIHNYRNDPALRASFNRLAEKTFGLNFESWYQNGFWGENYDPYSIVINGEVAANVSLNRTDMLIHGERKRIYQLGTVMTREDCRNQGLIRSIMAKIEEDTQDSDGVYLFANDSVLGFYPKFNFRHVEEFQYSKHMTRTGASRWEQVPMDAPEKWALLKNVMDENRFPYACRMADNPGLIFFYVSQFMQDCVYRCADLNAWVIAETEGDALLLHDVFAPAGVTLEDVIGAFGEQIRLVTLGFAPEDPAGWEKTLISEEDSTFFVKGDFFREFARMGLRIPTLSHA